jgi:exodeoxyribonuclease VII large subunit
MAVYTVKKLNNKLKNVIGDNINGLIKLTAEVSQMRPSKNHLYLTLKDSDTSDSEIKAVVWRWSTTKDDFLLNIREGEEYTIYGTLDIYVKNNNIQFIINRVIPIGIGAKFEKIMELRTKLEKRGYFNKKRVLPKNITKIGIITSFDGAAVTDILHVLKNNNFDGQIIIKNCICQGLKCPKSIVAGIEYFNDTFVDVLIITRGGGSDSDLLGYSDESVVRAIHKSKLIIISAVGHKRDHTLSDDAADIVASTPSVAAELVSSEYKNRINNIQQINRGLQELRHIILSRIMDIKNVKIDNSNADYKIKRCKTMIHNGLIHIKEQLEIMRASHHVMITTINGIHITSAIEFNKFRDSGQKMIITFNDGAVEL